MITGLRGEFECGEVVEFAVEDGEPALRFRASEDSSYVLVLFGDEVAELGAFIEEAGRFEV